MRKTRFARLYNEDVEVLKQMNGSIANAVNILLHGNKEDITSMIEAWGSEFINPKIEQIRKTLNEQISIEIERRFKELPLSDYPALPALKAGNKG